MASYGVVRSWQTSHDVSLEAWPNVYFYDKSEKKITLDAFRGEVVLVNLWASWCVPCVAELPSLDRLQKKMPQISVIAVSLDNTSLKDVAAFLNKKGVQNLAIYWDKDGQIPLRLKYQGIPTSYLVDARGRVVKRYEGSYAWDKDAAVQKDISSLLSSP